jgi:GNAT superfamily N-acetyltransferase
MDDRDIRWSVEESPAEADAQAVKEGLLAFNVGYVGEPHLVPFGVFVRDARGAVAGGLLGRLNWSWLYIEKLWLPERLRGRGHGSRLLCEAEAFALARGCRNAYVDTFDHQARPFYERHGYALFGTLEGFPPGSRQYFLRKDLG